MVHHGSQAIDHAFDLPARLAEIEQQAELPAGGFETIGVSHLPPGSSARGDVRVVQGFDGLQLNQKCVLDQQVHDVLADHHVFVMHPDATSLHNR